MIQHDTKHISEKFPEIDSNAKQARNITWIGFWVNLLLALLKFSVGFLGHSQAVLADGVHSLSDVSTDLVVLFGVKFWSSPPDEDHQYGHHRIEALITVIIGIILILTALGIGYRSISTIKETSIKQPGLIALIGAVLSIFLKEWLYRWTIKIGTKIKSSSVIANAWHHRSDAFSSIPVVIAVTAALITPKWAYIDHIGALIVSFFIFKVAWNILKSAIFELTDRSATQIDSNKIHSIAIEVDGVKSAHAIRSRRLGSGLFVDLHILVDGGLSVKEGHDISEAVKNKLIGTGPNVLDAVIHLEPFEPNKPE
ncbi:MAG: cation diffusion facilitator family transporter [Candidatus Theseobacter exili]|nr:cation diffusion facilitator family transporter [Candidatus Theseobacter exili]